MPAWVVLSSHAKMDVFTVDSFSHSPFTGNPAGVCVLEAGREPLSDNLMQKISAEMNLSETAFVQPLSDKESISVASTFSLKWFTPICEINLCGHGTLATAAVIFQMYNNSSTELSFSTLGGDLKAIHNKEDSTISLDFPLAPPSQEKMIDHGEIINLVSGGLEISDCQFSSSTRKLLLRLSDGVTREQLESLPVPSPAALIAINQSKVKGVILTLKSSETEYDFYSRYFAPWVGIPEDPVTGSAHTVLGPYWSTVLNKKVFKARQCSPRGGDITVKVHKETGRVSLTGSACIVLKGKLNI